MKIIFKILITILTIMTVTICIVAIGLGIKMFIIDGEWTIKNIGIFVAVIGMETIMISLEQSLIDKMFFY